MQATSVLVLLAAHLYFTQAANSSATLEVTENRCEESHACTPRERCSSYNESIASLRILPEGSPAQRELIFQVRKLVCNKERRGVCCLAGDNVLQSDESHMEDDNEENEEDVEPDLELNPPPLLSGPRPKWAPNASKCCK